jgi:hypothetical protein
VRLAASSIADMAAGILQQAERRERHFITTRTPRPTRSMNVRSGRRVCQAARSADAGGSVTAGGPVADGVSHWHRYAGADTLAPAVFALAKTEAIIALKASSPDIA